MPPPVLLSLGETLCRAAETPAAYRSLARRLLAPVADAAWERADWPRVGQAFVDARDADGLRRFLDRQVERHPEWAAAADVMALRREAGALAAEAARAGASGADRTA